MAKRGTRRHVALLRGINVGRGKRVAMADLRGVVEGLGYTGVVTLLNSGNVVFTKPAKVRGDPATRIGKALESELGLSARVIVLGLDELDRVIAANPLPVGHPSRFLVAFAASAADLAPLAPLLRADWSPDALALGERVAYLACERGLLESELVVTAGKALGDRVTMRNWATVTRLAAL